MLDEFHAEALRRIDVCVSGTWQPGRRRDWRGDAVAAEPIVAVVFSRWSDRVSWCKSERARPTGQPVRLLLGHYDDSGRDVHVTFSVGGGQVVSRTTVDSAAYQPAIDPAIRSVTGVLLPFTRIDGSRQVDLRVLFLAGSDVKLGRNGLWRLRPQLVEGVPEAFRTLLSRGRTGELPVG